MAKFATKFAHFECFFEGTGMIKSSRNYKTVGLFLYFDILYFLVIFLSYFKAQKVDAGRKGSNSGRDTFLFPFFEGGGGGADSNSFSLARAYRKKKKSWPKTIS